MVSFSKKLQNHILVNQYNDIKRDCVYYSYDKERSQNSYTKKLNLKDTKNNKDIKIGNYLLSQYKKQQSQLQKSSAIVDIATKKGLVGVFITLTLPSNYHPYNSKRKSKKDKSNNILYTSINKNFDFVNIETSIIEGYKLLSKIHRNIYKRVKDLNTNIYYISCFENHKSNIPHLHMLMFIEPDLINQVENIFYRNMDYYNLKKSDFQILNSFLSDTDTTDANLVASYIRKYMFKSVSTKTDTYDIKSNKIFESRFLDGYLKKFKIRQFRMSNLPLTLEIYKKVYYSLPVEYKNQLVEKLSKSKTSIFKYIMDNIQIVKTIANTNSKIISNKYIPKIQSMKSNEFNVYIYIEINNSNKIFNLKPQSKTIQFKVFHYLNNERTLLYDKNDYKTTYSNNSLYEGF